MKIVHKRRKEKKTDYKLRLSLLKSGEHRLAIRKSNSYTSGQIIKYEKNGDKTLVSANSKELKELGWKNSCRNLPAAYLAGLLLGKKAKKNKIKKAVLDLGLQESTKGSKLYAFLKGFLDSGIDVPHSPNILPKEERIKGSHIDNKIIKDFESVKKKILK